MLNSIYYIGIMFFIIFIFFAVIETQANIKYALVWFISGLGIFVGFSFYAAASIPKSALSTISRQYYQSYKYYTNESASPNSYIIGGHNYSDDVAEINYVKYIGTKPKYKAEVITYDLSKSQKKDWKHILNLAKQIAVRIDQRQYSINIVKQ